MRGTWGFFVRKWQIGDGLSGKAVKNSVVQPLVHTRGSVSFLANEELFPSHERKRVEGCQGLLPKGQTSRQNLLLRFICDTVDLDLHLGIGEFGFDGRAGGLGFAEELGVNLVHGAEILSV